MMMNNWQKVCRQIRPLIKTAVLEDTLHQSFEALLETVLNWDKADIQHEVPVYMGKDTKRADIVLNGNGFGIVMEMKRPNIGFGVEEAGQLQSYMRFLGHKFGFLIGHKIKMFYDDGNPKLVEVVTFGFDEENPAGKALFDILDKEACSVERLKDYIDEWKNRPPEEPPKPGPSEPKKHNQVADDDEIYRIRAFFEDNGFEMNAPSKNRYYVASQLREGLQFCIEHNADRIWKFFWVNESMERWANIYDRNWFVRKGEALKHIPAISGSDLVAQKKRIPTFRLYVEPVDQKNFAESLLNIAKISRSTMGY
jgi:hypothetical protein